MLRYIVPFHPKRHPHFFTDVLVIGGGLAGCRAALAVDPSLNVLLICKDGLDNSNSVNAQGGIAAVWAKTDTLQEHIEDTFVAGGELCDKRVVEHVVNCGPSEIRNLIDIGTKFDKTSGGEIMLGREGGHRRDRILHANGDSTGREVMRSLIAELRQRSNVRIWENTFALDLLTVSDRCRGAIVYWKKQGETELIWAKQTILACGGIGQVYRETTNPTIATGDGVAMAYRAGAAIRDMEFVQFHPTVLYIAGSSRSLISEAMRGEGARLVDRNGYEFMRDYDSRGDLAPRDVVSLSIVRHLQKTNTSNVYLDLTHKPKEWIYSRFPGIAATCKRFGIDVAVDKIPVRPGTHFAMGGVVVDIDGRTTISGLWAAGEVSSTGLHGANRLASNSLLESLVYGESTGRGASKIAKMMTNDYDVELIESKPLMPIDQVLQEQQSIDLADICNSLKSLLWRNAGVIRNESGLRAALDDTLQWSRYIFSQHFSNIAGWEVQNMLIVARLIIEGALSRCETRGAHNREDYPKKLPNAEHTVIVNDYQL
ncbi:MAG: L-aspartate oxidase [Planctomycetaceae bacterium]|jgi:L-aspartate oxidase|nr:L-aspartate oxidase [Planctomycetaceae bacterium]